MITQLRTDKAWELKPSNEQENKINHSTTSTWHISVMYAYLSYFYQGMISKF